MWPRRCKFSKGNENDRKQFRRIILIEKGELTLKEREYDD
jgi:hypothetical protein